MVEIAEECGLSSNAISKRIKKLKENGVIVGTTLCIDGKEMGYTHIATIGINLDYAQENKIARLILKQAKSNLIELSSSIGKYDLCALIITKGLQELDNTTQTIRRHPGVKRVAVNLWVSEPHLLQEKLDLQPTRD